VPRPKKTTRSEAEDKSLVRFGVAMQSDLLARFDHYVQRRGYTNRSEALRDLVRAELVTDAWSQGESVVAAITIVYDHHVPGLTDKIVSIQHDSGGRVVSTMHVHLDATQCLEIIVAQGPARELERMADELVHTRGVLLGRIVPAGRAPDAHVHHHPHDPSPQKGQRLGRGGLSSTRR
jgi:CopG family nickel-responsive transcriptional regulator